VYIATDNFFKSSGVPFSGFVPESCGTAYTRDGMKTVTVLCPVCSVFQCVLLTAFMQNAGACCFCLLPLSRRRLCDPVGLSVIRSVCVQDNAKVIS